MGDWERREGEKAAIVQNVWLPSEAIQQMDIRSCTFQGYSPEQSIHLGLLGAMR